MNLENIQVRINKPYPEIEDATDDKMTVGILKNLATSRASELSAILQYQYDATLTHFTDDEIAKIIDEISVVEMSHLSMLMEAIVMFGGLPKYEDSQGNIFATTGLMYPVKLKDMLMQNIEMEKGAIRDYREATIRVRNESLKKLFERIIMDEERHLEIFEKLLRDIKFLSI